MLRFGSLLLAAALVAAGCSDDDAGATTTPLPSAEAVLADAAVTMQAVDTLNYEIELTGAPITLLGVELRGARGQYAAPDASQAVLSAAIGGLVIELGTIAIGETSWVTNPLTGDWDEYTGSRAFNPAIMFDPELGWRPLLTEDISGARLVTPVEGENYVVAGTAAGDRVEVLTAGLVESQPVSLQLSIDRTTGHVTRMEFSTAGDAGETRWVLDLSEFGAEVSINPPQVG